MSEDGFEEAIIELHEIFVNAGLETLNEPHTLDHVEKRGNVIDCVLVARNAGYDIIYAEVRSNRESIASDLAKSHITPCLVITKEAEKVTFTVLDQDRPRHWAPDYWKEALKQLACEADDANHDLWAISSRISGSIRAGKML